MQLRNQPECLQILASSIQAPQLQFNNETKQRNNQTTQAQPNKNHKTKQDKGNKQSTQSTQLTQSIPNNPNNPIKPINQINHCIRMGTPPKHENQSMVQCYSDPRAWSRQHFSGRNGPSNTLPLQTCVGFITFTLRNMCIYIYIANHTNADDTCQTCKLIIYVHMNEPSKRKKTQKTCTQQPRLITLTSLA